MSENSLQGFNLESNPAVDTAVLQQLRIINAELTQFGLSLDSGYNLAPALGGELLQRKQNFVSSGNMALTRIDCSTGSSSDS